MRIMNDTELAKGRATVKLQQNHRKLKMQRYFKDSPQSKALVEANPEASPLQDSIFADRKSSNYRTIDRSRTTKQSARPVQPDAQPHPTNVKEEIIDALRDRFDCAMTPAARNSHHVDWNSRKPQNDTGSRRYLSPKSASKSASKSMSRNGSCSISINGSNCNTESISRLSNKKSRSEHKTQPAIE